jgi:hypothetical protein
MDGKGLLRRNKSRLSLNNKPLDNRARTYFLVNFDLKLNGRFPEREGISVEAELFFHLEEALFREL